MPRERAAGATGTLRPELPSGVARRLHAALTTLLPRWPGWRQLPRDSRDTLFLLGVIAWTIAPHVTHLPVWCVLLTVSVLLWRARLALLDGALPDRWMLVAVLVAAAALTLWSHRTLLGKEPGVTLAVVLMALKTLELRARRDAFVIFFLGFFLILTHFLYSQSLPVGLAMLVSVWGLLTALVLAHMPVGQPSLRQASGLAARIALLGAPIMLLLFVLFPRVGPLWGVPQDGISRTGLSNTMRMGSLAEVAQDDSVALRLRFLGAVPPPEALYLRGPVLAQFDGVEWHPLRAMPQAWPATTMARAARLRPSGEPVRYQMTLEPLRLSVVPLLEASADAPQIDGYRVTPRDDLQWQADRPLVERVRFTATAYPRFSYGPLHAEPGLEPYRELPAGYNPRTLAWAAALKHELGGTRLDPARAAEALLLHIRRSGYRYTLAAEPYRRDAIDEFWLDRREGFCEHYAAAFVVIMRALGVPARVVTGYQGADPLPIDGYYLVRQSSAHAWAEYWEAGRGWIRADPTAAVAPDRISRSRRLVPMPGLIAEALGNVSPALLEQLREVWQIANNRWNQWVLNYSRGRQFDVLQSLGLRSPSAGDLLWLLIVAMSTLALGVAGWAWWDRNRTDPWQRQALRLRRALATLGVSTAEYEAPRTLAERVRQRLGVDGAALVTALERLDHQRYGRTAVARPDALLTRRFVAEVHRLRHRRHARAG